MSKRWLMAIVLLAGCDGGEWHGAEPVDDRRPRLSAPSADPSPAVAMAGPRAIVVWGAVLGGLRPSPGTWARWHNGSSWSEYVNLGAYTQHPTLVGSTNGSALALVTDGVTHFDGSRWSTPARVDWGSDPELAMDGSGRGLAVGKRAGELVVTAFDPSLGWGPTNALAGDVTSYHVAMSASGAAIVVWSDGIDIRARLRSPLGVWSANRTVDTGCAPVAVRMFGVDRSVVLGSCGSVLRLLRSAASGGFFDAGETPNAFSTQLAVNESGGAVIATIDTIDDETLSVLHAPPELPLTAPLVVSTSAFAPLVGSTFGITLDSDEQAHIVFSEGDGGLRIKGRELDANARTLSPAMVMDRGTGNAYYPSIAGDGNGNAIVAWNQSGSNPEEIWANLHY